MREILKAFIKSGSGSVANVVLNVAALKILARILGPAGIGLFSLLRQILQTALTAGTLSGQTALVQGASSQSDRARQKYLQTVLLLFIAGGIVMASVLILFAPWLAQHVTGKNDPMTVSLVRWLSLPVFLNTLLVYSNSVLNAERAIGRLAIVQGGTALGLALSALPVALAVKHGHELAFIGMLVSSMTLGCALGFTFLWRGGWLAQILSGLARGFSAEAARHFFTVAGTIAITAIFQTGSLLVLRALVVNEQGLRGAGIFDAAWTLSMGYVTLVLISFQTYYLPTLTQTSSPSSRIILMQRIFRISTLLMSMLVTAVVVMKPLVISVLYSAEFTPSLTIMRWMLIGDYFKVTSWIFAMPMLAYADMKTFLWTEVSWYSILLGLSALMITQVHSLQGIGVSFALTYLTYMIYAFYYAHSRHHFTLQRSMILAWLGGLALILGATWQTWSATQVLWATGLLWVAATVGFAWLTLSGEERRQITLTASSLIRA